VPVKPRFDILIVGGGLAGITAALELLDHGLSIAIVDRDSDCNLGGLAVESFGGMLLVDTPIQRLHRVHDSPERALQDWHSFAQFADDDHWPRRWAELYVNRSVVDIYDWLKPMGIRFFPVPHWVERGENGEGNSLPRYHIVWGTGLHLMRTLIAKLRQHPKASNLEYLFDRRVEALTTHDGDVTGVSGRHEQSGEPFELKAGTVLVASGGINGDLERVRREWDRRWGAPPQHILNGAHRYADGRLHGAVADIGGRVAKLHQMWNYAGGIHHPSPRMPLEGLSVIPTKSALWLDATGRRFGPEPMMGGFDTHLMCKRIAMSEHGYAWQLMNRSIALKELAISGAESNPAFRDRKALRFVRDMLLGNRELLDYLVNDCEDVVTAATLEELVEKMNALNASSQTVGSGYVELEKVQKAVGAYDAQIALGGGAFDDRQLKRIEQVRQWRGDRSRTCRLQPIVDDNALPLIAMRQFIVSRKSMGGIRTDLHSRVLSGTGEPIPGLYAAGEAAGFGGGGISGLKSLEGTFISNCILNARMAVRSMTGQPLTP
jgi:predicted oxidoreductase